MGLYSIKTSEEPGDEIPRADNYKEIARKLAETPRRTLIMSYPASKTSGAGVINSDTRRPKHPFIWNR